MVKLSKEEIDVSVDILRKQIRKNKPILKVGGVVSLGSYLSATRPDVYDKIEGDKAIVKAKELDDGNFSLYINLPLSN